MNFWKVVIDELEFQNKTRKWLAMEASFDVSTIGTGLKRQSMPQVDLALRIADVLEVPVEYLVTGKSTYSDSELIEIDIHKYHKYSRVIENLDTLSEKDRKAIIKMIEEISKKE